tara:strand:- start:2597 stop:3346 length:750 start_codon:yes stop_codon:yes gene_type:complete
MYEEVKRRNDQYALGIDLKWNILFDANSRPDSEDMFIHMLNWMGMPPDKVDYLKDWQSWQNVYTVQMASFTPYFVEWDYLGRYWHTTQLDPTGFLCKAMYFRQHNVFWHIRGMDLRDEGWREEGNMRGMNLEQPEYWMIPLLMRGDSPEEKIGGSDGAPPEYVLSDLWDKYDAETILRTAMGVLNLDTCGDTVADMIKQFYPINSTKLHSQVMRTDLIIPENWKSMLPKPDAEAKMKAERKIEAIKGLA